MISTTTDVYPYEIHITVQDVDRDKFVEACAALHVKPVLLDLQSRTHGILKDAMTSSRMMGTLEEAQKAATCLGMGMRIEYNMCPIRYKIETVPWHPAAQSSARAQFQYLESHLQLHITDLTPGLWYQLVRFCREHGLHLSSNVFKKMADERTVIHMATLREYAASPDDFAAVVHNAADLIAATFSQIVVKDIEIEFAILDTMADRDVKWMEEPPRGFNNLCQEILL